MLTIHHKENIAPSGRKVVTLQVTKGVGDLAAAGIVKGFTVPDARINAARDGDVLAESARCTFSNGERTVFVVQPNNWRHDQISGSLAQALGEMVHPFAEAGELTFVPPLDGSS